MKKIILTLCTAALVIASTAFAANPNDTQNKRGNWNPILITNNTNTDLFYMMETYAYDIRYLLGAHTSDVYHTKYADEYLTLQVGICVRYETNRHGKYCAEFDFHYCLNHEHYNGNLIRSIDINSLDQCTVTCLDGDKTSCRHSD